MMNIVNKRLWYFLAAAVVAVVCIVFLATEGLQRGVDFQAGTELTVSFDQQPSREALIEEMSALGYPTASVAVSSEGRFYVQTQELTPDQITAIKTGLAAKFGTVNLNSETVPQNIANEAIRNAGIAIVVAVLGMLIYIAWAFRKMPNPFKYGVCAVAGLAWDILLTLGIYSILGSFAGWSIDLMFIAGILAVLGYSINNSIIIFDRMRENTARGISPDIEIVANASIIQTLGRSFNSSLTTLFVLFVLALFVGSAIQNFVIVLIIGTISGVLTSTFLSPELLVSWQKKNFGKLTNNSPDKLAEAKARG